MAKGKAKSRSPGKEPGTNMVHPNGLEHPISKNLCKRLNRFFEALVFLSSLAEACEGNGKVKAPSDTSDPGESPSKLLERFINKMAQICDNHRHGITVTSLAIIQRPDKLVYAFAANQRKSEEIEGVHKFVFSLLFYVNQAGKESHEFRDDRNSPIFHYLLRNILNFNVERIQWYREQLEQRLSLCIADCERDKSEQSVSLMNKLIDLQRVANISLTSVDGSTPLASNDEDLVRAATELRQSATYGAIEEKARTGRFESPQWCGLQHFIGRLVSYYIAVQTIIQARKRYPELFDVDNLEIQIIESSKPLPNPMNAFQAGLPPIQKQTIRSAHDILSRMTSGETLNTYRQYAEELQRCNLNGLIERQCGKKSFRPIVHSEVLLLEWLLKEFAEEVRSIPFYEDVKYIGCSKPTCRLCEYYFAAHSSGVRVRPPHRNVYPNWIIPDVLEEDEMSAHKTKMIDAVLQKVREDALTALREKTSERKRFDSNTQSSLPTNYSLTGVSNFENMVSRLGELSMAASVRMPPRVVQSNTHIHDDTWSVGAQEGEIEEKDESEDEDEEVILFAGRIKRS